MTQTSPDCQPQTEKNFQASQFFAAIGYQPGREVQIVVGKNEIYRGILTQDGLTVRECKVVGKLPCGSYDWQPTGAETDGSWLAGQINDGGVFLRPNRLEGGILNSHFQGSDLLFYEFDDLTLDEQQAKLQQFSDRTGLKPAAVVFSGGKSLHVYFRLEQELGAEDWKRLMRKLCVVQQSDPALANLNRLMRLPGSQRFKSGQWVEQSLVSADESAVYSVETFEAALDQPGLFLYGVGDDRWRGWRRDGKRHDSRYLLESDQVLFPPRQTSSIEWETPEEDLILQALNFIPARNPGKGDAANYSDCLAVLQALNSLYGATKAEAIAESWSPSVRGTSWDVAAKIRSFGNKRDDEPAAVIFGVAKRYGWRFPRQERSWGFGRTQAPKQAPKAQGTQASAEASELSDRDEQISARRDRFRWYWPNLKRDFQITGAVSVEEIIYEGHCPDLDLSKRTIAVQGWLGAGKTEAILRSLGQADAAIAWSAPSNGLLFQTEERARRDFGIFASHYQSDVANSRLMLRTAQDGMYLLCPDSFKTYAVDGVRWEDMILVIDEFSGIRKSITSKTEQEEFFKAIALCKGLIVADAFLSDADLGLIKKLRLGTITLYRQGANRSPVKINWIETKNKEGEFSFSHNGVYFDLIDRWLEEGFGKIGRIAIAVDSISFAKTLKAYIESKEIDGNSLKVWIACSETVEENRFFMRDPNPIIVDNAIEVVIYTPTAKSGLDIQASFDKGLLICCGVLPPTEMIQMLGRCRQCLEWFVSAPRFSGNPAVVTPSLNGKKVRMWADKLTEVFDALAFNHESGLASWNMWESLVSDIEKAFTSEYVQALLEEYFEVVEVAEVSSDSTDQWRKAIDKTKTSDADLTLSANLSRGLELLDAKTAPTNNQEVWDVKLAQQCINWPKLFEKLVAANKSEFESDRLEAVLFAKLLMSRRMDKIKNYVRAEEYNPQDGEDLIDRLQNKRMSLNASAFRQMRALETYHILKLKALARYEGDKFGKDHIGSVLLNKNAIVIRQLYAQFQADLALQMMWPQVETVEHFWAMLRHVMSYFGFQYATHKHRIETEEQHKCGTNADGSDRFTNSKVEHFGAWYRMEDSGSKLFQENFELITETISANLAMERQARKEWKDRQKAAA